jgi:signal peptidase I
VLIPVATVVGVLALVALSVTELLLMVGGRGTSMAPTMPACNGRGLAEGFTYRFRDPHRGEIVVFHASGEFGGAFTPDPNASGSLEKRVIGIPGDTVVGRGGRVLVNGTEADDIHHHRRSRLSVCGATSTTCSVTIELLAKTAATSVLWRAMRSSREPSSLPGRPGGSVCRCTTRTPYHEEMLLASSARPPRARAPRS